MEILTLEKQPLTELPAPVVEEPAPPVPVAAPHPLRRVFGKSPLLLWRLGFGPLVGRTLMIMTTTGRHSGLPRRTAIQFLTYQGCKYVYSAHGAEADWWRNLAADPHLTIQTAAGTEAVTARRMANTQELEEAYAFLTGTPFMRRWAKMLGVDLDREAFFAHPDRLFLLTFDPADGPAAPPVRPDLWWVWPATQAVALFGWLLLRRRGRPGSTVPGAPGSVVPGSR
jgi:deazaflavin-dependent oxidoreductase (nitroreductase family)